MGKCCRIIMWEGRTGMGTDRNRMIRGIIRGITTGRRKA